MSVLILGGADGVRSDGVGILVPIRRQVMVSVALLLQGIRLAITLHR